MKKRLFAATLAAAMAFGMITCGSGAEVSAAETVEGSGNLNIWLAGNGELETSTAYKEILDNWVSECAPGFTYELTFIAWSDYFTKLSTALASGEGPDVFMTGYGQLGTMVGQGYTANLSEYLGDDWSGYTDIPENILSAGMKDGNIYGILEPSTRLYYYRKDIAEANGITEDELQIDSLEDLKNLADKMNFEVSGTAIAGFHVYAMNAESIEQMLQSIALNYDPEFHMWGEDGTASYNSEAGVQAVDYMKSILAEGYNIDYEAGFDQFANGVCSIVLMSEAMYRNYANTLGEENVGILPCSLNTLLIGNFLTVNSGTEYMDASVSCLKYLYTDEAQKTKATLGMFPTSSTLWDWYAETYPEYANVPTYYEHSYAYSNTLIPFFNQAIQTFRDAAAEALAGGDTQACLDAGKENWDALAAENQ